MKTSILIIDDNDGDLELIRIYLNKTGFEEIFAAQTGEEGIDRAREIRPCIVVTDTNLPQMDGFEICRKIKEIKELNTKVIIMSGHVDDRHAAQAREAGADDYCAKTMNYGEMLNAVKKLMP